MVGPSGEHVGERVKWGGGEPWPTCLPAKTTFSESLLRRGRRAERVSLPPSAPSQSAGLVTTTRSTPSRGRSPGAGPPGLRFPHSRPAPNSHSRPGREDAHTSTALLGPRSEAGKSVPHLALWARRLPFPVRGARRPCSQPAAFPPHPGGNELPMASRGLGPSVSAAPSLFPRPSARRSGRFFFPRSRPERASALLPHPDFVPLRPLPFSDSGFCCWLKVNRPHDCGLSCLPFLLHAHESKRRREPPFQSAPATVESLLAAPHAVCTRPYAPSLPMCARLSIPATRPIAGCRSVRVTCRRPW